MAVRLRGVKQAAAERMLDPPLARIRRGDPPAARFRGREVATDRCFDASARCASAEFVEAN